VNKETNFKFEQLKELLLDEEDLIKKTTPLLEDLMRNAQAKDPKGYGAYLNAILKEVVFLCRKYMSSVLEDQISLAEQVSLFVINDFLYSHSEIDDKKRDSIKKFFVGMCGSHILATSTSQLLFEEFLNLKKSKQKAKKG
jgi:hypothetical protein